MIGTIIFLAAICIIVSLLIIYFNAYNNISIIKIKMDNADEIITTSLKEKKELMNDLYILIKKHIEKKDYLKGFSSLKDKSLDNYQLDLELSKYYETMNSLKNDYKKINTAETLDLFNKINDIDQTIYANKNYFNRNNNKLIKLLKGFTKIVGKLNNINIKNSYEIKEPIKD